jgi:hypothetical protein
MRSAVRIARLVVGVFTLLPASTAFAAQAVDQRTADAGWKRLQSLAAGADILVELTSTSVSRRAVTADRDTLVTLNPSSPGLSRRDADALLKIVTANASRLAGILAGGSLTTEDARIGPDGVFIRHRRIADTATVFERWKREDVVRVQGPLHRPRGGLAALGGFILGSIVGWLVVFAVDEMELPAVSGAVALGTPIAGSILAYRAIDPRRHVIYQRATTK